ncbi:MAG: hypothetical protein AAGI70_02270 [Pseudomonadota bacterium]
MASGSKTEAIERARKAFQSAQKKADEAFDEALRASRNMDIVESDANKETFQKQIVRSLKKIRNFKQAAELAETALADTLVR